MKIHPLKKGILLTCLASIILAFVVLNQSAITGRVNPADGADAAWAIAGSDTVKANIVNGSFSLAVKPGTYKVMIDAHDPYKDVTKENIEVKEDGPTDIGEIMLEK